MELEEKFGVGEDGENYVEGRLGDDFWDDSIGFRVSVGCFWDRMEILGVGIRGWVCMWCILFFFLREFVLRVVVGWWLSAVIFFDLLWCLWCVKLFLLVFECVRRFRVMFWLFGIWFFIGFSVSLVETLGVLLFLEVFFI